LSPEELLSVDVEKLWELQSVLSQLADREKAMSVKPEAFAEVDREYQASSEEMERLNQSLESLGKERRRVEGELSDQQELLKKYQGQLMQVKNQQQYAAAWKEIDAARKHVKELEESALKTMTDIDGVQSQLDQRKSQFDDLKERHDTAHGEWQSSLGDLRSEAKALRKKADQLEAALPEPERREFLRTFKQRGGIAVSKVLSDSCTSCRTRIRPALAQRLRRGEMVICEGCHRILYLEKTT
jgi:predicted  nucleic acid-binding Zn-ribbon protein